MSYDDDDDRYYGEPEVVAQYDGRCKRCHKRIRAQQDMLTLDPEREGVWVHIDCA